MDLAANVGRPDSSGYKRHRANLGLNMGQFLAVLTVHWVADFILQTHWQAQNKSKNNWALTAHVAVYTVCLFVAGLFIFGVIDKAGVVYLWAMANGILHWVTDYYTSRATSKLYAKQDWHNFFVVVGLDQLIHQFTLAATMMLILGVK